MNTQPPTVDDADRVRESVRREYAAVATQERTSCCGPAGPAGIVPVDSTRLGYSADELAALPEGADLGLGCGNPQAIAALSPGETVLDLGSGAGFDAFLAARKVGASGRVIGVDMTPEMVSRARASASRDGLTQVEFRLGEIEHLPVADASVDVIMSNCVINLSPDKASVFREAFRVLKPGGRLAISDVVALAPVPAGLASDEHAIACCVGGASLVEDLRAQLEDAGFDAIDIRVQERSAEFIADWLPGSGAERWVASALIEARKPTGAASTVPRAADASPRSTRCCG